jgi:hypothetical protein
MAWGVLRLAPEGGGGALARDGKGAASKSRKGIRQGDSQDAALAGPRIALWLRHAKHQDQGGLCAPGPGKVMALWRAHPPCAGTQSNQGQDPTGGGGHATLHEAESMPWNLVVTK